MLNTKWKNMTRDERKQHFIERLFERYGISITSDEYEDLCTWVRPDSPNRNKCKYLLKISANLRAYFVEIQGQNVLCIYSKNVKLKIFTSAIPAENYYEPARMVPKIFRKKGLVKEAVEEYQKVLDICCRDYQDFGDDRKNYEYYSTNCEYPFLMIAEHKDGMTVRQVYRQVLKNMKNVLGIHEKEIRLLV